MGNTATSLAAASPAVNPACLTDEPARPMQQSFLLAYFDAFKRIEGWFSYDAALLFMAYNQLLARHGIAGDVLEIGVHRGLSTIGVATLRGPGKLVYAIDLFDELQDRNVSRSGDGKRSLFDLNMRAFYPDADFVRVLARPSGEIDPQDLGRTFSFCHIDGGHSRRETCADLKLCHSILLPGGIVVLDDYFNPDFPGVCEGAVEFMLDHPDAFRPLAIGFNKVLFQKQPAPGDLNAEFQQAFPYAQHKESVLWDQPALVLTAALRHGIDLQASTPQKFYPLGSVAARALFAPATSRLISRQDRPLRLQVGIVNTSLETFPHGEKVFGLSYHLLSKDGRMLRQDNPRAYLTAPLKPGQSTVCELAIQAPHEVGEYRLEIDLIWDSFMWFQDIGNPTVFVDLLVTSRWESVKLTVRQSLHSH